MADRLNLTANIMWVSFLPRDTIEIGGIVWPTKFNESRVVDKSSNRYTLKWFWHDDLPKPVAEVLTEAADAATIDLVQRKALPTFWPKGLMAEEQVYPFDMHFEEITIFNNDWDKDKLDEAKILITSEHHLGPKFNHENQIHSTVKFDVGWKLNDKIFETLEKHL